MKNKCTDADRYQAKRPPRCGCASCAKKWERAEIEAANRKVWCVVDAIEAFVRVRPA